MIWFPARLLGGGEVDVGVIDLDRFCGARSEVVIDQVMGGG